MTNQQGAPEALRLAEEFEKDGWIAGTKQWCAEASAELRRLNAQVEALSAAQAGVPAGLSSLELMKTVMRADESLAGRCTRGTTNWAAAIGKAVQDAMLAAAPQPTTADAVDAQRYRYLRDCVLVDGSVDDELYVHVESAAFPGMWALYGELLDTAVDAKRAALAAQREVKP